MIVSLFIYTLLLINRKRDIIQIENFPPDIDFDCNGSFQASNFISCEPHNGTQYSEDEPISFFYFNKKIKQLS